MKLISLSDYVLQLWDDKLMSEIGIRAINYAQFLKQKIKLEMFVPCDENGDVLEVVPYYADGIEKVNEYKKAKERCLFEGFKSVPFSNSVKKGNYIIDFNYTENINIESLLHHDIVFELTQVALKQLE